MTPFTCLLLALGMAAAPVDSTGDSVGAPGSFSAGGAVNAPSSDSPQTRHVFIPEYEVQDTTQVVRKAITLSEIIRRCTQGESQKLEGWHDLSYTARIRTLVDWEKKKEIHEATFLAYEDETGFSRRVIVDEVIQKLKLEDGKWGPPKRDKDKESPVEVSMDGGMDMFTNLPIFLEQVEDYNFELESRKLLEDRVIFEIAFRPKSTFKPLPSGTVYVDTKAYQIIHEIYSFEDQNPFPLLVKDLRRFSRQWKQLDNGTWVTHRLAAEVTLHSYFGLVPGRVSVAMQLEDYAFDQGYDAKRFGER